MHVLFANFSNADRAVVKHALNRVQLTRMHGIRNARKAEQYFWSRVLYNGLMRRLTQREVTWDLPKGEAHKPVASADGRMIYTSLAHSDVGICLAYDYDAPVAVDLEWVRDRNWQALAEVAFQGPVQAEIAASKDPLETFYIYWTLHECGVKYSPYASNFSARTFVRRLGNAKQSFIFSGLGPSPELEFSFFSPTILEQW